MPTTDSLEHMISDLGEKIERNTKILNSILGLIVLIISEYSLIYGKFCFLIIFGSEHNDVWWLGGLALIYLTYSLAVKHGFGE